jgi:hypothetical protein
MLDGSFTVTFENPFWVRIFERHDECGYSVAKFIVGAEPNDEIIRLVAMNEYPGLQFSEPSLEPLRPAYEPNFKRQQRELKRLVEREPGLNDLAREFLQEERERLKVEQHRREKAEREAEEERKRRLHLECQKEKKRGH